MDNFDERMEVLRSRFVERARTEKKKLQAALSAADHKAAENILHGLAGNAGLFGYPALSAAARELEDGLRQGASEERLREIARRVMAEFPTEDALSEQQTGEGQTLVQETIGWERFQTYDWAKTRLGPRETWPKQLHFLCEFLLSSEQPMFILWGSERLFIFNRAYQAMWGLGSRNGLGRRMDEVAGDSWSRLRSLVDTVFEGRSFRENNFAIADPDDGRTRYFDFSYTPIRNYDDPAGSVVAALCISADVTERFLSAERSSQEREILAQTVANVTEGVALIESDFSLVLWNEPFRKHFGFSAEQIRHGMNAAELIHDSARRGDLGPGDPGVIVAALVDRIENTESGTLEIQRNNGTVLRLFRRALSGGRQLLVSRDITDDRRAARLKDELVSTVSHELRTPLAAIAGALGMVNAGAAGELPERTERLVKIAQRNSERLIALVNDLLDADKLQSGKVQFEMERIDLGQLVTTAVEQNQPYGAPANVGLQEELLTSGAVVTADRNRLLQVLSNLISNAVKFSPPGEQVTIRLTQDGARARISVIDHGMGVPENFRGRLFERFSQHDGSAARVQQGTGLGLSISKSIVEQLGGSIQFEPTIPKGATFHVHLPLAD